MVCCFAREQIENICDTDDIHISISVHWMGIDLLVALDKYLMAIALVIIMWGIYYHYYWVACGQLRRMLNKKKCEMSSNMRANIIQNSY